MAIKSRKIVKTISKTGKPVDVKTHRFQKELTALLKKFSSHQDGSIIRVNSARMVFKSEDVSNCPKHCIRRAEVIRKGKRVIEVWCEC